MLTIAIIIAAVVGGTGLELVRIERRSHILQWECLTELVAWADERARKAGWVIVAVQFKPGFITGRGSITWRRDDQEHVGPLEIPAAETTRAAARETQWWKR